MEQHKLEGQFKKKLNSREIKPTEMAWDRLNAMLSVAELDASKQVKQKTKSKFSWLYIAASFIGFLFVATVFFNQKENTIGTVKNKVALENTIAKDRSNIESKSLKIEPNFSKTLKKSTTNSLVQAQKNNTTEVENTTLKTPENVVAEIRVNNPNESILDHKNGVSENIDHYITSVEKTPQSGAKQSSVKVNSSALLSQVDQELQVSFREKALNSITQKYKEAKEALVNRNNQ